MIFLLKLDYLIWSSFHLFLLNILVDEWIDRECRDGYLLLRDRNSMSIWELFARQRQHSCLFCKLSKSYIFGIYIYLK